MGVEVTFHVFLNSVQVKGRLHILPVYTRNVFAFYNPIRPGDDIYIVVIDRDDVFAYIVSRITYQFNLLKPTGHVMHQQFNIQELYVLPTLYLCVLYLSENKQ